MRKFAILAFLLLGVCLLLALWRPHFRSASPTSADIRAFDVMSTNVYYIVITNSAACAAIVGALSQGRPSFGMSKESFELTFRYADGGTDMVYFFPGFGQRYTFIHGRTFTVSTNNLYKVLADAGVDVSKIQ